MADTIKDSYIESNAHTKVIFQRGRDVLDFELNELQDILRGLAHRLGAGIAEGADALASYQCTGDGATADLTISGGIYVVDGIPFDLETQTLAMAVSGGSLVTFSVYATFSEAEIADPAQLAQLGETTKRKKYSVFISSTTGPVPTDSADPVWKGGTKYRRLAIVARPAAQTEINAVDITDTRKFLPATYLRGELHEGAIRAAIDGTAYIGGELQLGGGLNSPEGQSIPIGAGGVIYWNMDDVDGSLNGQNGARILGLDLPTDASEVANKEYVDSLIPSTNYVINGGFDHWQRTDGFDDFTGTGLTAKNFYADRWYVQAQGQAWQISRQDAVEMPFRHSIRIAANHAAGASLSYVIQEIDRDFVKQMRGKLVTLSLWVKRGSTLDWNTGGALQLHAGTGAETETMASAYTGSSVIAFHNFLTPSAIGPADTWVRVSATSSLVVPATTTTLGIRLSGPSRSNALDAANNWIEYGGVMLTAGEAVPQTFAHCGYSYQADLNECLRYYEQSVRNDPSWLGHANYCGERGVAVADAGVANGAPWPLSSHPRFKVKKRATPTISRIRALSAVGDDQWFVGGSYYASVAANVTQFGFNLCNNMGASQAVVTGLAGGDWIADAEI